jgi:hypothetical protein
MKSKPAFILTSKNYGSKLENIFDPQKYFVYFCIKKTQ